MRLKENQRFTVRLGPCAVLLGGVESLGPAAGAIGGGTGGVTTAVATEAGNVGTIVGIASLAALGAGAYEAFKKNPVSPS